MLKTEKLRYLAAALALVFMLAYAMPAAGASPAALIKKVTKGPGSLYLADWGTGKEQTGRHVLRATALDQQGRSFTAARAVRVCR